MNIPRHPEIMSAPTVVPAVVGAVAGFALGTELQTHLYPAQVAASADLEFRKKDLEHQVARDEDALQFSTTPPRSSAQVQAVTATPNTNQYQVLANQLHADRSSLSLIENQLQHSGMLAQDLTFEGGGAAIGLLLLGTIAHIARRHRYVRRASALVDDTITQIFSNT